MRPIRAARSLCSLPARWTKRAAKELGGRDPAALLTKHTAEGIAVKPLYMSSDLPAPPPDGETARWKSPPLAVPRLGSCASSGAWLLWLARRSQERAHRPTASSQADQSPLCSCLPLDRTGEGEP